MDKTSSVLAALEAGKLPSTQQVNHFIDWLNDVGIAQIEPKANTELSAQGRVLAKDLRQILEAYKRLGKDKNADNILQEAIWHLTQGDLTTTAEAEENRDQALQDITAVQGALRNLICSIWSSASLEGTSILHDLLSVVRLSLADAAGIIEERAGLTKESLREVEKEVQEGQRDSFGRDKKRLEEEQDVKVAWEHGMDTVKDAGSGMIGAAQGASTTVQDKAERTSSRLQDAFYKVTDRAQRDPQYRESLDTLCGIIQTRLNSTLDAASDPDTTLSSFIADPTPEQHIPKAFALLRKLIERLSNTPLEPLIQSVRTCATRILNEEQLKAWFDDFFAEARKTFSEPEYARSEEAKSKRTELWVCWRTMLEDNEKWGNMVEEVKKELNKIERGLRNDEDLVRVREAHAKLGSDIEEGLVEAGQEAETGMQAAIEQATWFWQDLFKVYIPRVLAKMRNVPIPRTEFKDDEIEFVLENLDISSFNILPSHVYIRNITDIDIATSASPSTPSRTAVGALTHVRIQAVQLALNDVSFWYKDKKASALSPSEFTGLLSLKLPEKGIDVDFKVRLIPANVTGANSRDAHQRFHVIEKAEISISDDVQIEVRESNHPVVLTLFRPIMIMRIREALEKTMSEQLRAVVDWADATAFDVGKRREVFEDTGLGVGGSLMAAVWSEVGRIQRESQGSPVRFGVGATGTGLVVEQSRREGGDEFGEGGQTKKTAFAMGVEPQILSGDKRGPLGTGSEPIRDKVERVAGEMGMDVDVDTSVKGEQVKGAAQELAGDVKKTAEVVVKEGKRRVSGFRKSVERKCELEKGREGWQSASFDF